MPSKPRFNLPDLVGGVLADILRLEVETDPVGLENLVKNPDGALGGYGWVAPVAGTVVRKATTQGPAVEFVTATSGAVNFTTELLPVTAGKYVAAAWDEVGYTGPSTGGYYRARFEFVDAAGAVVSSSAQTAYASLHDANARVGAAAVQVPATATRVRLRYDMYGNTSGAAPSGGSGQYRYTNVTVAQADTAAELSGETVTNLITNPSVETNATGWIADLGAIERTLSAAKSGTYKIHGYETSAWTFAATALTPAFPVTPGKDYTGSIHVRAESGTVDTAAGIKFYDAAGAEVGVVSTGFASTGTAYVRKSVTATAPNDAATARVYASGRLLDQPAQANFYADAAMATEGATLYPYFDGTTVDGSYTYAWTGTAHGSTSTRAAVELPVLPPVPTVNVLGPTHAIAVNRPALDAGTLSAEILDAALDPADSALIRPGRAVRLQARRQDGTWATLFTGTLNNAKVAYHLLAEVPDAKKARITLTATDNTATLAAAERPDSVATIAELPFVLEGCGVPWNVNGSGSQVGTATIRAKVPQSTALDQVAITRDTTHAYAWVDKANVLQAWTPANLPTTPVLTLDETVYTDCEIAFDTDACINEAVVVRRSIDTAGQTVETTSTFIDAASISEWDRHRAEFTILAPTNAATFASEVLAANGTPTRRLLSAVVNVRDETFLPAAHLDLYDLLTVVNTDKGINQSARPTAITHTITPEKWLVGLEFSDPDSVAAPQVVPPLTSSGTAVRQSGESTVNLSSAVTGVLDVTFPVAFPSAPRVIATAEQSNYNIAARNRTTTGFQILVHHIHNTAATASVVVSWFATIE